MKRNLFRFYIKVMQIIGIFIPVNPTRVVIINEAGFSGSNPRAFAEILANYSEFDIVILNDFPSVHHSFNKWMSLASARFVICSHDPIKIKPQQKLIQFWHGVPLKRMGYLAKNTQKHEMEILHKHWQKNVDIMVSPTSTYDTLMGACMGVSNSQIKRGFFPRLKWLNSDETTDYRKMLLEMFPDKSINDETKIIFYMPTFRQEMGNRKVSEMISEGNYLALDDFNDVNFQDFLIERNYAFVVKLHPIEEKSFQIRQTNKRVINLSDYYLKTHKIDLYRFLNCADLLITDFSSVYFDFLVKNKPEIFITNLLGQYESTRGFLLEPYADFTPGAKVNTFESLKEQIITAFNGDEYAQSRERLRKVIFGNKMMDEALLVTSLLKSDEVNHEKNSY